MRLKFSAIEVFQHGKPVRIFTGQRLIVKSFWMDEQRIVFYEGDAIYLLDAAGGPPRKVFP